jgi:peptide/nickel transport system substrate-binding protein
MIVLNASDPWTEVDGERGSAKSRHPAFSDKAARTAMNLLVDRKGMQEAFLGPNTILTANVLNNPPRFRVTAAMPTFSIVNANKLVPALSAWDGNTWAIGSWYRET